MVDNREWIIKLSKEGMGIEAIVKYLELPWEMVYNTVFDWKQYQTEGVK